MRRGPGQTPSALLPHVVHQDIQLSPNYSEIYNRVYCHCIVAVKAVNYPNFMNSSELRFFNRHARKVQLFRWNISVNFGIKFFGRCAGGIAGAALGTARGAPRGRAEICTVLLLPLEMNIVLMRQVTALDGVLTSSSREGHCAGRPGGARVTTQWTPGAAPQASYWPLCEALLPGTGTNPPTFSSENHGAFKTLYRLKPGK